MRKKTLSPNIFEQQSKDLRQAAKYHWEFKRRNADYPSSWKQGLLETRKPENWDERFNPDLSFEKLIEVSVKHAMKGMISKIQDPKLKKAVAGNPLTKSMFELMLMEELMPKGVEAHMSLGSLTIKVHFDKIRSPSDLRKYVSVLIDTHYKMFLTPGVLSEDTIARLGRSRNLYRKYERILEAGDLYEKLKTKKSGGPGIFRQIAEKIFPKPLYPNYYEKTGRADHGAIKEKPTKNALGEAEEIVKEYQGLVNGGYQEIVYP